MPVKQNKTKQLPLPLLHSLFFISIHSLGFRPPAFSCLDFYCFSSWDGQHSRSSVFFIHLFVFVLFCTACFFTVALHCLLNPNLLTLSNHNGVILHKNTSRFLPTTWNVYRHRHWEPIASTICTGRWKWKKDSVLIVVCFGHPCTVKMQSGEYQGLDWWDTLFQLFHLHS